MIELRNISKTYVTGPTRVHALKDVDLDILDGEFLSIMGPSGSGKSTLMNIMGCLDRPTTGVYTLNHERVDEMTSDGLAAVRNKNIGFVFQSFNLLSRLSALENVEVPLVYANIKNTRKVAEAALEEVGLMQRAAHRPTELSGGECQRVAIARAIVLKPAMILADEPTGNLDTVTGREIIDIFKELNEKGTTVIIVTHEKEVAEYTKRIIRIRDGLVRSDTSTK